MNWFDVLEMSINKRTVLGIMGLAALVSLVNVYVGAAIAVIAVGVPMYIKEARKRRNIKRIPEVAMAISELWGLIPMDELLAKSGDPSLKNAGQLIRAGQSVKDSLEAAKREEPEISELIDAILSGYKSGGNVSKLLTSIAERHSAEFLLEEESKANHLIERLTLASSAGVMVPFVIGAMIAMTNNMYTGALGFGGAPPAIRNAAVLGSKVYIIVFSLVSGAYLGISEGAYKKALLYSGALAITSWIVLQLATSVVV